MTQTSEVLVGWLIRSLTVFLLLALPAVAQGLQPLDVEQVTVFAEEGRNAGWPANHGIWSWGDEILVRFNVGWFKYLGERRHASDPDRCPEFVWARSRDGGRTWEVERRESCEERQAQYEATAAHTPSLAEQPRSFRHADAALFIRGQIWSYSTDRGRNWLGWYPLPEEDPPLYAVSRNLIEGPHRVTTFVGPAANTWTNTFTPMRVFRTEDAGTSWRLVSQFGEPTVYDGEIDYILRPSPVRMPNGDILVAVRRGEPSRIETWRSSDDAQTWTLRGTIDGVGSTTPNLFRLDGDRVVLIYGHRARIGSGIRGRISADHGRTWGDDFVLRGEAGNWDIGYPLTVQRTDGKLVTVYYFNDDSTEERYIGATIWRPPPPGH